MGIISNWMQRNWELEDRASRVAAIDALGAPGQEIVGVMQAGEDPRGAAYGRTQGTGFFAGDINDPHRQAEYATNLMKIPGMTQMGANTMENVFTRGGNLAWNREKLGADQDNYVTNQENQYRLMQENAAAAATQQQGFYPENARLDAQLRGGNQQDLARLNQSFEPANIAQRGAIQGANAIALAEANRNATAATAGGYATPQAYQTVADRLEADYTKAASPYRVTMERYNKTTDMINRVGGFDNMRGADDMTMLRDFIKMTVPNEAVMSDDQKAAALAAGGYKGMADSFMSLLAGTGTMKGWQRSELYDTMGGMAGTAVEGYEREGQRTRGRAADAQIREQSIFGGVDPLELKEIDEAIQNARPIDPNNPPKGFRKVK